MGLLLYKSNEMFSSTELIRKSKTIFNKIINNEIEKAIVLRDGKPSFLLMDFEKYENIMAEFEQLKEYVTSQKNNEKPSKKSSKKNKSKQKNKSLKEVEPIDKKEDTLKKELELEKARIDTDIESTDYDEITGAIEEVKNETQTTDQNIIEIEDQQENVEELTEEEEISNAIKSIESMNFDGDMKKMAEDKIKAKILQARRERAELLEKEEQNAQELAQEEQELQQQIQEEKVKKEQELKEFWD